jgi:hypothetical protein
MHIAIAAFHPVMATVRLSEIFYKMDTSSFTPFFP